ncbi:MAG: bifunctional pyr operon transcriptional regulator/uracil phosphoribosyltransferase PyrR [Gemmatimonadetes bacterium]|nr:bifunctional pyr operon transcriptional regulator/uracil phosphoribosyltransferase PyrR [Gemmatimonadota bacterium]
MATDLAALTAGTDRLAVMGVYRRGTDLSQMLADELANARPSLKLGMGSIDITLYRDDLRSVGPKPVVGGSELPPGGIDDTTVVLVDDVLFTGRTVRAALNELSDWGRPGRILLCVLVDRGGRELPIQPDIVGATLQVPAGGRVDVLVPAIDGRLSVEVSR